MARVNIAILGFSELILTGMGKFNSDDHYIYYCGQESLRRNGVSLLVNKGVQNAVPGCNLKNDRMISVHFQGKLFSITVIQVYAPGDQWRNNSRKNEEIAPNAELEVERVYEDRQDFLELTPKKDALFIIGDWNAKVVSQEIPGVTGKLGLGIQNEAGQRRTVLPRERTGHSKNLLPTTRDSSTWPSPEGNAEIRLISRLLR